MEVAAPSMTFPSLCLQHKTSLGGQAVPARLRHCRRLRTEGAPGAQRPAATGPGGNSGGRLFASPPPYSPSDFRHALQKSPRVWPGPEAGDAPAVSTGAVRVGRWPLSNLLLGAETCRGAGMWSDRDKATWGGRQRRQGRSYEPRTADRPRAPASSGKAPPTHPPSGDGPRQATSRVLTSVDSCCLRHPVSSRG